ncbi:FYN-binding protein 1 isoform X3 [Rhineura floridana]|uniref:FYN-binding protein 1 isoform X3 n=1 Tax=Rhineura floridana TaxID=261503 RepID=UPI002AC843E8|nr:FYN-binding protein 1 isoform X3 [Rhineura floridana]
MFAWDGKTNVKSIMAKFSNNPAEEVHRQIRVAGQPSLVTRPPFDKFSHLENAGAPPRPSNLHKSPSFKPPLGIKPPLPDTSDKDPKPSKNVASKVAALAQAASREANEKPGFPRPLGPKPTNGLKDESKPGFPKPPDNRLPGSTHPKNEFRPPGELRSSVKPVSQDNAFQKIAGIKEKITAASQENDFKPPFPKPHLGKKPSPHSIPNEEASNKNGFLNQASPSPLGPKPKLNSFPLIKDAEGKSNNNKGTDSMAAPFAGVALKHGSNQGNLSQVLQKSYGQQNNEDARSSVLKNIIRLNQEDSGSPSGTPPPATFVSSPRVATTGSWASNSEKEEKDKNLPKRKALPPQFKLGPPPQKPSRPPTVDLEKFRKRNGESCNKSHTAGLPPSLPPSISVTQATNPQLPPPPPPSASHPSTQAPVLPPRNIKPRENEESYDDVEFDSGDGNADETLNSDGEMYEDINDVRATSRDDERKREKEERKKSDKEQKEKEKKEQDIRKKFKLVGPIEVIHQARACTDFKGGKYDLTFKQGDKIEIIRITDNPEGKWLGRKGGSYGYIKTTMVEIDYDSLKRKPRPSVNIPPRQADSDQEVYDDVGDQDSISSGGQGAAGVGFPPPPPPDDIYDGAEDDDNVQTRSVSQDEDKSDSWPLGFLKILKGKDYQKKSVRETATQINVTEDNGGPPRTYFAKQTGKDSGDSDVYDDVELTDFPPPPKEINLGINMKSLSFGRAKSDERDSQKLKKMDKEEKEFRKKFKYEGDIQVLYTTTISRAPSFKKRGSKDLQVKPGESVDVIKNVDDTKVLCRNEEGKYGYVRRSCIADDDEEIYDDIADDGCIYDND